MSQQLATNLAPHYAGKPTRAPQTAPTHAAAGATSTRRGGLMMDQDEPQCGEQTRMVTSSLQLGECAPYRIDHQLGVRSLD